MVVQFILAVRKGRREVKPDAEKKPETVENKLSESGVEIPVKEEENFEVDVLVNPVPIPHTSQPVPGPEPESRPNEEELIVETSKSLKGDQRIIDVEEYYVKYRNFSYLHCEWKTEDELYKGDKRIAAKLKRFKQKMAHHANIFENVSIILFVS